jgi:hypothetical protein
LDGRARARARRLQGRNKATAAGKRWEWKRERREGEERGMGSTPTRAALFIGGPPNLLVAVPSTVQHASTALFRHVREKNKADFSLTD